MIKVSVMYPYSEGARFDHVYYRDRHMPMVKARLGSACAYYTVEKGLASRAPGAPPAFVAMCAFICDSVEGYQAAADWRAFAMDSARPAHGLRRAALCDPMQCATRARCTPTLSHAAFHPEGRRTC